MLQPDDIAYYQEERRAHFVKPQLRTNWQKALATGDLIAFNTIHKQTKNINLLADQAGLTPLSAIFMNDDNAYVHLDQEALTELLISNGVELTVPDKLLMVPADHAMLSGNREAALTVVRATTFYCHQKKMDPYVPNVEPFFATCPDEDLRIQRYKNIFLNHQFIGKRLIRSFFNTKESNNGFEDHLSEEQVDYWTGPYDCALVEMPLCAPELEKAFQWYSMLPNEKSEDELNAAIVRQILNLRSERRTSYENMGAMRQITPPSLDH